MTQLEINTSIFYGLITNTSNIEIKEIAGFHLEQDDPDQFEDWTTLTVHEADKGVEFYVVERQGNGDEPIHRFLTGKEALEHAQERFNELESYYDKKEVDGLLVEEI